MDRIEREALRGHLNTLSHWLRNGKLEAPSASQLAAIEAAVDTMKGLATGWENYEQPIAILRYHITHPTALLFRDPVTIKVIKIAIDAMERRNAADAVEAEYLLQERQAIQEEVTP